jgi:hypothetical protein
MYLERCAFDNNVTVVHLIVLLALCAESVYNTHHSVLNYFS